MVRLTREPGLPAALVAAEGRPGSGPGAAALGSGSVRALGDPKPLVRGHAAWALGRIGTENARAMLDARTAVEEDAYVREGIASATG